MPLTKKQKKFVKLVADHNNTDILTVGGSRSGKTMICIMAVVYRAAKTPNSNHCILRRYQADVTTKIGMGTLPEVFNKFLPGTSYEHDKSHNVITLPNNARIWLGGLDDDKRAEKILGAEYSTIFFDEISQISEKSIAIAKTRCAEKNDLHKVRFYACNPPLKSHFSYIDWVKNPKTGHAYILMNPEDNLENIDETIIETLKTLSPREQERFLHGRWQDAVEGALWRTEWIEKNKKNLNSLADRVIISVDPAVVDGNKNDAHGIIVAARLDEDIFILQDLTTEGSHSKMAELVVFAAEKHEADTIVYEGNQGGEIWESIFASAGWTGKCERVHAKTSKLTRAEPVAAMYENGKVHHINDFMELNDELVTYDGTGRSPNRLDALVHAVTFLTKQTKHFIPSVFSLELPDSFEEEWENL